MFSLNSGTTFFKLLLACLVPLVWSLALVFRGQSDLSFPAAPDAVFSEQNWADEQTCANCHEQAEEFFSTGHANTMKQASASGVSEILQKVKDELAAKAEGTSVRFDGDEILAIQDKDGSIRSAQLDWCIGSGHHARTWISTLPGSEGSTDILEFRWTHFAEAQCFAVTPGQPATEQNGFFGGLGVLFDGPRAQRCFACHSSFLPVKDGLLDESGIRAGVTCQRCHGPRQQHVESEGQQDAHLWKPVSRDDAIRRCAQCHRSAEEVEPQSIDPTNTNTVRFQPVGLSQSRCFRKSEMRCTTCHDPHKTMAAQDSGGIWQCLQCHSPEEKGTVLCSNGRSDDCLACHMPKVELESPLRLTDHWIRIRKGPE